MTANQILETAADRGVSLFVNAGKLQYRAPAGAYSPALRELVGRFRGELVDLLKAKAEQGSLPVAGEVPNITTQPCPRCHSREFLDHAIHDGRSTRRDCRGCGRFVAFVKWYGVDRVEQIAPTTPAPHPPAPATLPCGATMSLPAITLVLSSAKSASSFPPM